MNNPYRGYWSRRINDKDRLIYKLENEKIYILACRTHYQEH
ncbi:MAG: type II toxin-antitoxin system YoeB family toxin [Clostridium neonatale]